MKKCLYLSSSFVIFSNTCGHLILLQQWYRARCVKMQNMDPLFVTNITGKQERMCYSYMATLWLVPHYKGICIIITLWTHVCTHIFLYTHWALSPSNYCTHSNYLHCYIPGHQMYLKVLFPICCKKYKHGKMILSLQDDISRG